MFSKSKFNSFYFLFNKGKKPQSGNLIRLFKWKKCNESKQQQKKEYTISGLFLSIQQLLWCSGFTPRQCWGVLNYTEEEWVEIERSIQWMQKGRSCVRLPNISAALLSPNLCVDLSGKFTLWESNPPCGLPRETIPWLVHSVGLLF